jgi:hypothetical protein
MLTISWSFSTSLSVALLAFDYQHCKTQRRQETFLPAVAA